jgi:hypothetical protein
MTTISNRFSRSFSFKRLSIAILSIIFICFISCNKDEIETNIINNSFDITIDNEDLKITNSSSSSNESLIVCNENCNGLFVSSRYQNSKDVGFKIEFQLTKSGSLVNIMLADFRNGNSQFESADFNPTGLMTISNFSYDETKKYLHFDFKGELVEVHIGDNFDVDRKRKQIEGSITITDVKNAECTNFISDLSFKTDNLNFLTNVPAATHEWNLNTNPYQFYFYSDNGYRTIFKSKVDLWNLEKGIYIFDQNNIENRIDFEQFIGNFRATQLVINREVDWKKYQTTGSYTITDHQIINGEKVTKGEFNLKVYDDAFLKYNITNAKFEVTGF